MWDYLLFAGLTLLWLVSWWILPHSDGRARTRARLRTWLGILDQGHAILRLQSRVRHLEREKVSKASLCKVIQYEED